MNIIFRVIVIALLFVENAFADYPRPWQIWFQDSVSPVMEHIISMHNLLMANMVAVVVFVCALLAYVIIRYNYKSNPVPATFAHNVAIEVIWTIIPVIILIAIAIPTFKDIIYIETIGTPELTVKVIGRQWYWDYEYPDNGNIKFSSFMVEDKDIQPGQIRLLEVDKRIVIPIDTRVRFLVTAGDVLHSFAVPAFGIKTDAVPGRVNEAWVKANKLGVYYGQCSELCGVKHGFMPIAVEVVTKEDFQNWVSNNK